MIAFIQICVTSYMLLKLIVYYTGFIAEKYPYKAENDSMIATSPLAISAVILFCQWLFVCFVLPD